jgi:Putative addiction module component
MNTKLIATEALNLPADLRAKLALELIESLDNHTQPEIEALWMNEAVRRADQIDRGLVEMFDSEVVTAQVRELLQ